MQTHDDILQRVADLLYEFRQPNDQGWNGAAEKTRNFLYNSESWRPEWPTIYRAQTIAAERYEKEVTDAKTDD